MHEAPVILRGENHRLAGFLSITFITGCPTDSAPDPTTVLEFECNVTKMFEERCGGSSCHSPGESTAAGLDLTSPGVEDRVTEVPGASCMGILASPADPEGSLLYQKVAGVPTCGARMPIEGEPLTEDEQICLRDWISGLLPAIAEEDDSSDDCPGCMCQPDMVENCYDGPPQTANVGICKGGTHICGPDGMSWGACESQVVPHGENCLTPEDENCDGSTPECSDVWSLGFGDELTQSMRSIAVDSEGNVYSLGDFEGVVSFGGDPLVATQLAKADLVIAKHDHYGNPIWSQRYGDNSNQYGAKLIIDEQDNLIVLARIYGSIDFGDKKISSDGSDIAVFKLDSDGNHLWSRIYGDENPDRAERMVVDSQGDVILTGAFTTSVEFDDDVFTTSGMRDAFVLKLDGATGDHVFSRQIGDVGDDYGSGVGVDANDDIFITGRFQGSIELGQELTSTGGSDIYLAKLDPDGAVLWSTSYGGDGEDGPHDLAISPEGGDIVLLGYMSETVDFGDYPLVSAGMRDIFVAAFHANGDHHWSANYGDAVDQFTDNNEHSTWMTLELQPSGSILFGGALHGTIEIDGVELSANGDAADVFYVLLDGDDGEFLAGDRFGTTSTDVALDLTMTNTGHVVMAGRAFGTKLDFGTAGTIEFWGGGDAFIAKLPL